MDINKTVKHLIKNCNQVIIVLINCALFKDTVL